MIDVSGGHEKTKLMLVDALNGCSGVELSIRETIAGENVCYFCRNKIPTEGEMFELTHHFVYRGGAAEEKFFANVDCMAEIRKR